MDTELGKVLTYHKRLLLLKAENPHISTFTRVVATWQGVDFRKEAQHANA